MFNAAEDVGVRSPTFEPTGAQRPGSQVVKVAPPIRVNESAEYSVDRAGEMLIESGGIVDLIVKLLLLIASKDMVAMRVEEPALSVDVLLADDAEEASVTMVSSDAVEANVMVTV
jgi:hypothetical protein